MAQEPSKTNDPAQDPQVGNQAGNQSDEGVKGLQRVISEKDVKIKEQEAIIASLQSIDKGKDDRISTIEKTLNSIQSERQKKELSEKYPDILPDILMGKSEDEIIKLVEAQRARTRAAYNGASPNIPTYHDELDYEAEVKSLTENKSISTFDKVKKIFELKRRI